MYEVSAKFCISAAHLLRNYEGKCSNLHGHNWDVTVSLNGERLDGRGMLVDFGVLKGFFAHIKNEFDHRFFNETPYFSDKNPTAENISKYIFDKISELLLQAGITNAKVARVSVFETQNCEAVYYRSPEL